MYHDEPTMKETLLDVLIKFTLSRYDGHVNAPCSPKLIAFFKIYMHSIPNFTEYSARISEATMREPYVDLKRKKHLMFPL